jgi:microcystin-dependent protein
MSTPYLSEIRIFGFNFPPRSWTMCNGQIMTISQNQALFSLLGTTYGGNGVQTFALPDLRGRVALGFGSGYSLGEVAGSEAVALQTAEIPSHSHSVGCTNAPGTQAAPAGAIWAKDSGDVTKAYAAPAALQPMAAGAIGNTGSGVGHENRQPGLTLNFCIALQGVFPSRN